MNLSDSIIELQIIYTGMYHNCGDFLGGDFADFSTIVILSKKIKKFEQKTGLSVLDAILINVFFLISLHSERAYASSTLVDFSASSPFFRIFFSVLF